MTAASAAAASGACSAISPEPQAGSESDRCRAGKPFFREGHRLAVGRARVSARGGVGDDASAPSKERERAEGAERPERRSDASLAKGDGPTRQPGRCRCATYDARPTPARLDAAPDERATVPPLPLLRVDTRAHSAAAPRERPRWLSRDVTRASPAEPPMPKREIERVVAFQRTLSRRAERARLRANISVERASGRAFSLKRNDLSLLTHLSKIGPSIRLLPVRERRDDRGLDCDRRAETRCGPRKALRGSGKPLSRVFRDIDRGARRERVDRAGDTGGARYSARFTSTHRDGRTTCLLLCERPRPAWWRPRRRPRAMRLWRVCAFRRARSARPAVPAPGGTRRTRAPARRAGVARTRTPRR